VGDGDIVAICGRKRIAKPLRSASSCRKDEDGIMIHIQEQGGGIPANAQMLIRLTARCVSVFDAPARTTFIKLNRQEDAVATQADRGASSTRWKNGVGLEWHLPERFPLDFLISTKVATQ
jgi:hypothetical protein